MFLFGCFRDPLETKDQSDFQVVLDPRDLEVMQEQLESLDPEGPRERKDQMEIRVTQESK